ncbi:carboxylate-amine ligase [Actinoallomurus rhizosphaericola]|uniref:carboxylate-amine ligase n=1 Tax=Actinoallomurus rhizosphaericola TaxID=2952536 RepID=UPI002093C92C|nr:glutamate--cysteine ligase [Actinoallomurus rhizosphaericola]MCO5995197.1 glutamate--cysteine ligase [Actinoallomurus rhizosphaericola]
MRSFGVEEELLLVAPSSGVPVALAESVTRGGDEDGPERELQRQQVETGTDPCKTLDELSRQLRDRRNAASQAARRAGSEVAALATSPRAVTPSTTPAERYLRMAEEYALTAQEQLTCGCHVHVSIESEDEGVGVLDRVRPWLAPLLAMTGNSPFWQERDSGYDSYRYQVWGRWPSAGPTEAFGTPKLYHETVRSMVESGTLLDEGMIYFDARLSRHYPTVEVRVADVCLMADDAVLLAALVRGLVETAAREWRAGQPPVPVRTELLRLASWRASRSGLAGDLIHPVTQRPAPAGVVVRALIEHVAPALVDTGDLQAVTELAERLLERGNGAALQRRVHEETGDLSAVVNAAVARTLAA